MFEVVEEDGAGLPVGEYLKSVRETRGLTLDEACRVTRIGKNYLVAIEEGNFDKLPNAAYIKGFLRLYAGFLSLSGDQVVERYELGLPPPARPKTESKPERPVFEVMEKAKLGGHGRWVLPLLLLGLVILAALFLSDNEEKPARPAPARPAAVKLPVLPPRSSVALPAAAPLPGALPAPGAAVVPGAPPAPSAAPAPGTPPAAGATAAKVEPPAAAVPVGEQKPRGIILRLRFNRDSWLSITIDDSISQRYDLKAGDIIEWKAARTFVLDLGDGGAVDAEFNGRPLKALGEAGKPAHLELKGE